MTRRRISSFIRPATAVVVLAAALLSSPVAGVRAKDPHRLTVGLLSEPGSLNPLVATSVEAKDIINRMYMNLLEERADFMSFEPELAHRWEFSDDSLSITFHLRPNAIWSDGVPVTARDVRFTWELQTDTLVAWPSRHLKGMITDVEVVDDRTAVFHFSERYPYQLMDANDGVIVPEHILGDVPRDLIRTHVIGRAPVGNGPYALGKWEHGQYVLLETNGRYFGAAPAGVREIMFKFVPDMVTLMIQLKKGEIDLLESVPVDQLAGLEKKYPHVDVYTYPSREVTYIAWNLKRGLFADAEVRRALTMAIDREEIIQTLWRGYAVECKSPISSILWAYDGDIDALPFDPEAARSKLAAQGWTDSDGDGILDKDGERFEFELVTNRSGQIRVDIATMVQSYLSKIGVKVGLRTIEFSTFIERVLKSDFDACVLGWALPTKADITNHWHSSAVRPHGMNISSYMNPQVDALIDRAKVTLDRNQAAMLWSQVQRIIYNDQPFTFLATPYEVNALDHRFCDVRPNAISFFANVSEWKVGADCE